MDFHQNGFQRHRGTTNILYDIQEEMHSTLEAKQMNYEQLKLHGVLCILKILSSIIRNGNLFNFIKNFLTDRTFQMKCNDKMSKIYVQNNGVHQGSTPLISLFILAINDTPKVIQSPVTCKLFADDFNIFCKGINPNRTINYLQDAIPTLQA